MICLHAHPYCRHWLSRACTCGRDKELAAVKINPADVQLIVSEIEVDQKQADRRLREHAGNIVEALKSYL